MKTFRPDYMAQSDIQVFQSPRVDSLVIFTIPVGKEVEVLQDNIRAIDPMTGTYFPTPITLVQIRFDGKVGYVNRRWLKPSPHDRT